MLPFLASELEALIWNITSRVIKPEVVKVCNTITELTKFDTKLDQNHLSLRRLTLNLRPEELFRNSWTVTAKYKGRKLNFFLDCQRFLVAVLVNLRGAYMFLGTLLLDKQSCLIQCTCQLENTLTDVEQGFLINAEMEVENLKEDNLVALRMIFIELKSTLDLVDYSTTA